MELPITLKQLIEDHAAAFQLKRLSLAAANISERYRAESINGGHAAISAEEIAAYSATRMPATFGAVSKALLCAAPYCGEINTVLDIGAGTGAAAWAAVEALDGVTSVVCVEREPEMISLGTKLMKDGDFPADFCYIERDVTGEIPGSADLVTASYVLGELTEKARAETVEKLWHASGKMLLIVEPGTVSGYANIIAAREKLLSLGAHIAAPCPHEKPCPLDSGDWCHFTVRVPRSKLHKQLKNGDAPYEDEKFCYIAAVREDTEKCEARVLRHPVIESGKITLTLCENEGIRTRTVTKKDGALFKAARKSDSGDEFPPRGKERQ